MNEPINNPIHRLLVGSEILGLFALPKADEEEEKFIAYGIYVDDKPFLCQKLTLAQYNFSYFLTTKYAWEAYLPENWKSWSLWDIVKNIQLCGCVRP